MKILLTGGNGFIGQHLQKKLHDHDLVLTSRANMLDNSVKYFHSEIYAQISITYHYKNDDYIFDYISTIVLSR